jgi:hypothetical protein
MISYSRWFYDAQLNSNPPNDTMTIFISNGTTTATLEQMVKVIAGNGTWVNKTYKISDFVAPTSTMQVWMQISDAGPGGTIVEGGFDKFFVYDSTAGGVNNITLDNNVEVYPNPSSGQFTISSLKVPVNEVNVYDVYGKLVLSKAVNKKQETVSLKTASGIYFLRLKTNEGVVSKKIVIQ